MKPLVVLVYTFHLVWNCVILCVQPTITGPCNVSVIIHNMLGQEHSWVSTQVSGGGRGLTGSDLHCKNLIPMEKLYNQICGDHGPLGSPTGSYTYVLGHSTCEFRQKICMKFLYKYLLIMVISFTAVPSWKLRLSTSSLASVHKTVTPKSVEWPDKILFYFVKARVFFSSAAASFLDLATFPNFLEEQRCCFLEITLINDLFEQVVEVLQQSYSISWGVTVICIAC